MSTAPLLRSFAAAVALLPVISSSQVTEKLRLIQTIPVPHLQGRLDHMDVDAKGKRLFLAALENGSVEVVDLAAGKWARSIRGFQKPQGIAYIGSLNKLFVASGDDGMLRVFRGDTLALLDSIKLEPGANRVAYDGHTRLLYVGYGGKDAGKDYGEIGVIDAQTNKHRADIRVSGHPAEILLDRSGHTLYAFISILNQIEVIDTRSRRIISIWPVSSKGPGDASFDGAAHRLFAGTHDPPEMIVLDSQTGKEAAHLPAPDGMDGVYFDSKRKYIYISGGRAADVGYVFAYQQLDPDHYEILAKISTRPGAGTSFWSAELNRYYVAAPASGKNDAAILVFEPRPNQDKEQP